MTVFRNKRPRAAIAAVLPLGLILAAGTVLALEAPEATAPPRPLVPGTRNVEPNDSVLPPESPVPGEFTPRTSLPAPVTVGDLGTVEGPVAGTLGESNGGLGYAAWQGSQRGAVEAVLRNFPSATPSITASLLFRKVALTEAPPPLGQGGEAFNGLRLRKLLEGGFVEDAADLAMVIQSTDLTTRRLQAEALLFAGRDDATCSDITAQRLDSAEAFWVELRAYCYALDGEMGALDLTRAVMEQQRIAEPGFLAMLDALAGGTKAAPKTILRPSPVHLRMLARLMLPIPANVVHDLGIPADLIAAESTQTANDVRLTAAERAFRGGALSGDVLVQVLNLVTFKPQDLVGAAAIARQEPLINGLARLRAALRQETQPDKQAELVHTAFAMGEALGLLPHIAELFADDAEALMPEADWGNWSSLMARALLLADKPAAAARWASLLDPRIPAQASTADRLTITFALAAPNGMRFAEVQDALAALAAETAAVDVTPPTLARAALVLGLYESTGRDMPDEARTQAGALLSIEFTGRRLSTLAMQRIDDAALGGRRGEVALYVADALGRRGASDLAPDVVVRLVRALKTAGIADAAQALTLEALLTRPGG